MLCKIDRELTCTLILSFCFMLLFAADGTMSNMQKVIVSSIADDQPGFNIDGYTVIGVAYTMFVISLWFGPYVNYAFGSRLTMFISSIGFVFFVGSYAVEKEWAIYLGGMITGLAAGTLWPAQGYYMIQNSSPEKTARNVAIFWLIYMGAGAVGNIFVFYNFHGKKYINQSTRRTTIYGLIGINILAVVSFTCLPKPINSQDVKQYSPIKTMKKSLSVLTSPKIMYLTVTFCYAGLQQAFWNGIYSPSIGFTTSFGDDAKELVALSGICMSGGALLGAFCPIVFSGWIRRHHFSRKLIVFLGIIAQLLCFVITLLNLPDSAVFGNTDQISFIRPNEYLALLGSVLISFGDSCLTTQIYSLIGEFYRDSSAEACALYKFFKGVFVAVSFYTCGHIGLHTQLAIMAVVAVFAFAAFFLADQDTEKYLDDNTKELPTCKHSLSD